MAASSADDHLTVGGDADVVVSADPADAACTSLSDPDHRLHDAHTQYMVLSVRMRINKRLVCGSQGGTGRRKQPASTTNIAFGPPAETLRTEWWCTNQAMA